jgi:hypothetical protein
MASSTYAQRTDIRSVGAYSFVHRVAYFGAMPIEIKKASTLGLMHSKCLPVFRRWKRGRLPAS